jgi:hypothetical protein
VAEHELSRGNSDSSNEPGIDARIGWCRRLMGIARFLGAFGLLEEAHRIIQWLHAFERRERFVHLPAQVIERSLGERFRLARLHSNQPLPAAELRGRLAHAKTWQGEIADALHFHRPRRAGIRWLPLAHVIPFAGIASNPALFADKITSMIDVMSLSLASWGVGPGVMPDNAMLEHLLCEAYASGEVSVPKISTPTRHGLSLLLNGHHRLIALMIMAARGLLPAAALGALPFEEHQIDLHGILDPVIARHLRGRSRLFAFSWKTLLSFDAPSSKLVTSLGATHVLWDLFPSGPAAKKPSPERRVRFDQGALIDRWFPRPR